MRLHDAAGCKRKAACRRWMAKAGGSHRVILQELLSLASSPRPRCRARAFTRLNLCNSYRLNLWCCVLLCDMPAVSYSVLMMFLAKCLFRTAQKFLAADNKRFKDSTCCTTYSMSMKCIHDSWLKERAFLRSAHVLNKISDRKLPNCLLMICLAKKDCKLTRDLQLDSSNAARSSEGCRFGQGRSIRREYFDLQS